MTDAETVRVKIVCGACNGTGWTTGYPGQRPQDDPGEYSCWACKGEKSYEATLAEPDASLLRLGRATLARHKLWLQGRSVPAEYEPVADEFGLALAAAVSAALAAQPGETK